MNKRKAKFEDVPDENPRKIYPIKSQMKKGSKLKCLGCNGNVSTCKGCDGKGYIVV